MQNSTMKVLPTYNEIGNGIYKKSMYLPTYKKTSNTYKSLLLMDNNDAGYLNYCIR